MVRVWLHEHERDYIYHLKKYIVYWAKKTFILIELKTYTLTKLLVSKKKKKLVMKLITAPPFVVMVARGCSVLPPLSHNHGFHSSLRPPPQSL